MTPRGQLLSSDIIVGMALLSVAVAGITQVAEFYQRAQLSETNYWPNDAAAVAQSFHSSGMALGYLTPQAFCFRYSNGTGNCTAFSCGSSDTIVVRRFTSCSGVACMLEVKVCR